MVTKPGLAAAAILVLVGGSHPALAAGPKVIKQCQTLPGPGSYILGSNLAVSGKDRGGFDCLLLGNDFITIDLNGFTIEGNLGAGRGITFADSFGGSGKGFDFRNGTISGFARGIDLRGIGGSQGRNRLERMRIELNSDFGVVITGSTIVKDSIFARNGRCQFSTGCPPRTTDGSGLDVGTSSVVTGNISTDNAGSGLKVGTGSTVANNSTHGNSVGLSVDCPSSIIGNTAIANSVNLFSLGVGCNLVDDLAP